MSKQDSTFVEDWMNAFKPDLSAPQKAFQCGIYFLINHGVVVYVGQSKNIYGRLGCHVGQQKMPFTHFAVVECAKGQLNRLEAKFIHEMQPEWNLRFPTPRTLPISQRRWRPIAEAWSNP